MQNNESNASMGFLRGLLIGAVLGVLFAPKRGEETRQELKDRVNRAMSDLGTSGQNIKEGVEILKDNVMAGVEDVKENIADKLDTASEDIRNKGEEVADRVQTATNKGGGNNKNGSSNQNK